MKDLDPIEKALADRMRFLLSGYGWDVKTLHDRCKLDPGLLRKYAEGRSSPGASNLSRLAEAFEVTAEYLLGKVPRLDGKKFDEVVRDQSAEVYINQASISADQSWLIRKLAESDSAPRSAPVWATVHAMVQRTLEIQRDQRRTGGAVIPFLQ